MADATTRFTSATLYAIGTYQPALAPCMEYSDLFATVPAGTSVCVTVGHAFEEGVLELAELLGIDPWAPAQHHLDPARLDAAALDRADYATAEVIEQLRAAGFAFHFMLDPGWA